MFHCCFQGINNLITPPYTPPKMRALVRRFLKAVIIMMHGKAQLKGITTGLYNLFSLQPCYIAEQTHVARPWAWPPPQQPLRRRGVPLIRRGVITNERGSLRRRGVPLRWVRWDDEVYRWDGFAETTMCTAERGSLRRRGVPLRGVRWDDEVYYCSTAQRASLIRRSVPTVACRSCCLCLFPFPSGPLLSSSLRYIFIHSLRTPFRKPGYQDIWYRYVIEKHMKLIFALFHVSTHVNITDYTHNIMKSCDARLSNISVLMHECLAPFQVLTYRTWNLGIRIVDDVML